MPNRSRGAWDVVFESEDRITGYQLAEPSIPFELSPGRKDELVLNADVPRVIDNLDAGMGYSRRIETVPNGYAYTLPGYTRAPGGIFSCAGKVVEFGLPASGVSWTPSWIRDSVRFSATGLGDQVYLLSVGPDVLQVAADWSHAVIAHTFAAPFSCSAHAVINNRLYIAGGSGMAYLDGATGLWSAVNRTVLRSHLAVVNWRPQGVPTDVLVGISPDFNWNAVTWCPVTADPMVPGNWSAPVRIGADQRYPVHKLVAAPRRIFILRPDGVYEIDELATRTYNVSPWVGEGLDFFNGGWGMHIGSGLYYSHAQGLTFIPTTGESQYHPEWAHPGWGLPYEGPVRGRINTGTLHDGWGLAGMWSDWGAPESYILAGKRAPAPAASGLAYGQATHIWHGAEAVIPSTVQHIKVHALEWAGGQPQLLITTGDSGSPPIVKVYRQSLPKDGTPLQELLWGGGFEPAEAGSLFLPADPWDRPSSMKNLLQFDMVTERLDPGNDILKAYATADGSTDWTHYGDAEAGYYSSLAPLETTEGRFIRTRVDAVGSPILRSLELRSAVGVELREARQYTLILAWDNALKGARGRETADPEKRLLDLVSLLGKVVLVDDAATAGPVRCRVLQVLPGGRQPMGAARRTGSNGTEGAWAVTAKVLVSLLDRPFRWDGSPSVDRFDADRTWR